MAAQPRRPGSDAAAAPVPFSYAQAAKGLSNTTAPAAVPIKPSPGTMTPSKDANVAPTMTTAASIPSWADDAEAEETRMEKQAGSREAHTQAAPAPKQVNAQNPNTTSSISSPDLGASSSSTVIKEDDASSLQNASSESTSTWENKSQASTSVEKTTEPAERTSEKAKGKNVDKPTFKPLQEAPIPAVNPWTRRADELKAKAAQKVSAAKPANAPSTSALPNSAPQGPPGPKGKGGTGVGTTDVREKGSSVDSRPKAHDDERVTTLKREAKADANSERTRKGTKGRSQEKDTKPTVAVLPLPPDRDQESWPTPDSAVDEDRKKAQDKGEKNEKERKEGSSNRPHGKQEWVTVPYTPTVVFNTPLPSTAPSRRGGRGGGRGGTQNGGRSGGFNASGASHSEKDVSAPCTIPNGESPKRGRPDTSTTRDASPKDKRTGSAGSTSLKEARSPALTREKPSKPATAPEAEPSSRRVSVVGESASSPQIPGNNNFPRQHPSARPNKGRRSEFPIQGDRRNDSESVSPIKETAASYDRRVSAATQTDVPEGDRRPLAFSEAQNGQSKAGSNERRTFSSFSGRERGRGGRGARGGYQNGHHQFTNGHPPTLQTSSTFPLRSPTSFHPDQNAYFAPPPAHGRNFRNGPRSQSVTTENTFGRVPGYSGGPQQTAPIQTFMGSMYDFPMHPMSAIPFSPYGVDQATLLAMVTTQLEYYFSVENLCKDIFLRKHMDSKGFVYLSVIAEFNRIKQLTVDMELIKYVCYQSRIIEFRVGLDGKDRLRRREGWEQWVLGMSERDSSAQNDGQEELYNPPIPCPSGFEQVAFSYPGMPTGSPTGPAPYSMVNGVHSGPPLEPSTATLDNLHKDPTTDGANGFAGASGHTIDTSNAVSGEPDSFSDEQVETLSVIVRKQDQPQTPTLPPSATRTFSNGSIDSKSGVPDESEMMNGQHSTHKINGASPSQGFDRKPHARPRRSLSPFKPSSAPTTTPVRLYWVKGKDGPVESIPFDSTYESYTHLRSKALEQRQNAVLGNCPYDMDVLYQFWSHFLIRNFNLHMYQEFQQLAFEDSAERMSDVGLTNLIKYYGESLLSSQNVVRERVARDYVELVKSEHNAQGPAFRQLRSALRNGALDSKDRKCIGEFLDAELRALLE